eukprot:scaffold390295_cov24-Prasinocladus_malaysianus.AAC.2
MPATSCASNKQSTEQYIRRMIDHVVIHVIQIIVFPAQVVCADQISPIPLGVYTNLHQLMSFLPLCLYLMAWLMRKGGDSMRLIEP